MPTERKSEVVERLRRLFEGCTIAISTDFSGMTGSAMTELRRSLRDKGVEFHVVKNRLAYLAADAAGRPVVKEILQGPTGLALGFGDPVEPARALAEFLRNTRHPLAVKGGVLGERVLTAQEVSRLAALPSKDQLIAQLLGLLQGPIAGLARVLNAPVSALATVLQRHIEAAGDEGQSSPEVAPAEAASSPEGQEKSAAGDEGQSSPEVVAAAAASSPEGPRGVAGGRRGTGQPPGVVPAAVPSPEGQGESPADADPA